VRTRRPRDHRRTIAQEPDRNPDAQFARRRRKRRQNSESAFIEIDLEPNEPQKIDANHAQDTFVACLPDVPQIETRCRLIALQDLAVQSGIGPIEGLNLNEPIGGLQLSHSSRLPQKLLECDVERAEARARVHQT
jgi:hypothetical protein